MLNKTLKIGDLIEVPPVQTVIRLEDGRNQSEAVSSSFVFTDEVRTHFTVLARAMRQDRGRGYFLQGDFGSGKSHFLAALSAWLCDRPGSQTLSEQHPDLQRLKNKGQRYLTVEVSLVNFRDTTALEKIVVEAIAAALAAHGIETRLTPLAAFLAHFQDILKTPALAEAYARQAGIAVAEIEAHIKADSRRAYVESVRFLKEQDMPAPEVLVEDKHETFARVLKTIRAAGFDGLWLLLDELSEFFRSKPDARGLNEDARTLQLLGELTGSAPVWIIAAVQESIERTGDISQVTFRKIRDRFPIKLVLSTVHIKALISKRLVRHKPGIEEELYRIYEYLRRQFPSISWSFEEFQTVYPIHPTTIALLDGLGELFSEHRGIVDFVYCRLAGDENRRITGILDRPSHQLLSPESIYDHFAQRMAEFSAFNIYPRHILPHLDEVIQRVIEDPEDQILARRIVRILVLYRIHPTAGFPPVKTITELVSCDLSEQNPDLNFQFVAETILDVLATESKFLTKQPAETGGLPETVYTIVTQEDPSKNLKSKIEQRASEIPLDDSRLLREPLSELADSLSWPGPRMMQNGIPRMLTWRQSSRRAFVCFFQGEAHGSMKDRIRHALAVEHCDFAFVCTIGRSNFKLEHTAVWEIARPPEGEEAQALREYLAAGQILAALQPTNPADAPLVQPAHEARQRMRPSAHQTALKLFFEGNFTEPRATVEPVVRQLMRFDRLLETAAAWLLEERFPGYREIAPRKVLPSRLLYQQLIDEFISPGSLSLKDAHTRRLNDAVEGLAAPLGLVELRAGTYVFAPDPENHPLLAALFEQLSPTGTTPLAEVLFYLRRSRYGLPQEMAVFLLCALAHGGLITLLKSGRSMPLDLLRLTRVETADALAPGEVIGKLDRETLLSECTFLTPARNWESFGLRQQREAWQDVIKFGEWAQRTVTEIEKRLTAVAEFSAFEAFDLENLRALLGEIASLSGEIKRSYAAREGLERFLKTWRDSALSADQIEYVGRMRTFFNRHAEQFVFVNHYMRHTAVMRVAKDEGDIAGLRENVMAMLDQPDTMIKEEDPIRLTEAFERFKKPYASFYGEAHAGHYSQFEKKPLSRYARRAVALLQRLGSIEMLDRPAGMHEFLRQLTTPAARLCKRNAAEELLRSPVCSCGFVPGETAAPQTAADPEVAIEQYLGEYLAILRQPAIREAISARVFALADAEPDLVRHLRGVNALLEDKHSSAAVLLDILDDVMAAEIHKALTGRVAVQRRELKELATRLDGRRLAPAQVQEVVKEWMAPGDNETIIAIEQSEGRHSTGGTMEHFWWQALHPGLFREDPLPVAGEMEAALERRYPAATLRDRLRLLDDAHLAKFVAEELFHTQAVRTAWLLLAERILNDAPWPVQAVIEARHVNPTIAAAVRGRLRILQKIETLRKAHLPESLRLRLPLSEILSDPWSSDDLQLLTHQKIKAVAYSGAEWLATLPEVEPFELASNPLVIILDGVPVDVWLEARDALPAHSGRVAESWQRLTVAPVTAPSVAAHFGFTGDALDEFSARDIPYHQIRGNEAHSLADLLPEFAPDRAAVIRVSLVDDAAHTARLRLFDMPVAVSTFLKKELPGLLQVCADQKRPLLMTADHGLSLTRTGLTHGKGGVYECSVFRMQWLP